MVASGDVLTYPGSTSFHTAPEMSRVIEGRTPYQLCLRAAGNRLDQTRACSVRLLEVPGGFEVQWQHSPDETRAQRAHMAIAELEAHGRFLGRKLIRTSFRPTAAVLNDRSYENVFRALGSELDAVDAYGLLVEEIEGEFLASYQCLVPDSYAPRKHVIVLGEDETVQVLSAAAGRRKSRGQVFSGLLGA